MGADESKWSQLPSPKEDLLRRIKEGQMVKTNGRPYTTPFSDISSASKNTSKRYTEEKVHDCKAGMDATGIVGVLKSLIQIGRLPWNPLVCPTISKSKDKNE